MALFAFIVWCGLGPVAVDQARSLVAHRRLEDLDWMRHATADAQRATAHRALGLWLADPHDAFLVLLRMADRSSIRHLRAALARAPKGDLVACTWEHGQEALAKLEQRFRE